MFTAFSTPARVARIGSVELGPMPVKILASLMPVDTEGLLSEAGNATDSPVDILEWRADYFAVQTKEQFIEAGKALQAQSPRPVLWTMRTDREGGLYKKDDRNYLALLHEIAASGLFDAIDVELMRAPSDEIAHIVEAAHQHGTSVIVSYHNFESTPEAKALADIFSAMHTVGADVLKVAVMPEKPEDVLVLMQAVMQTRRQFDTPVLAMSMGPAGQATRVLGSLYGSCATFASLQKASAPGQIEARVLANYLNAFEI